MNIKATMIDVVMEIAATLFRRGYDVQDIIVNPIGEATRAYVTLQGNTEPPQSGKLLLKASGPQEWGLSIVGDLPGGGTTQEGLTANAVVYQIDHWPKLKA